MSASAASRFWVVATTADRKAPARYGTSHMTLDLIVICEVSETSITRREDEKWVRNLVGNPKETEPLRRLMSDEDRGGRMLSPSLQV